MWPVIRVAVMEVLTPTKLTGHFVRLNLLWRHGKNGAGKRKAPSVNQKSRVTWRFWPCWAGSTRKGRSPKGPQNGKEKSCRGGRCVELRCQNPRPTYPTSS